MCEHSCVCPMVCERVCVCLSVIYAPLQARDFQLVSLKMIVSLVLAHALPTPNCSPTSTPPEASTPPESTTPPESPEQSPSRHSGLSTSGLTARLRRSLTPRSQVTPGSNEPAPLGSELYIPGDELSRKRLTFVKPTTLIVSSNNPGAMAVSQEQLSSVAVAV